MAMQEARQQVRWRDERHPAAVGPQRVRRAPARRRGAPDNGVNPLDEERLATALGWFSIGLGLAEVAAPGSLARLVGIRATATIPTPLTTSRTPIARSDAARR